MSSRVLRARRLRDHVSVPGAASPAFLTSLGRCEACPSDPPDSRSAAPVAVTGALQYRCPRGSVYTGHFVGAALLGGLTMHYGATESVRSSSAETSSFYSSWASPQQSD